MDQTLQPGPASCTESCRTPHSLSSHGAGMEELGGQPVQEAHTLAVEGKRWMDGGYLPSNLAAVTEEVVAISTKHLLKFVFLRSGKSRLYVPGAASDGVSVVTARADLAVLAWSERCVRPRVFVYQYNNPLELGTLAGAATMEYRCLSFSHDKFLLGISGVPDYIVHLWDWAAGTLLTSLSTGLGGPNSAGLGLISAAFPPDTSGGGTAKMFAAMWGGRVSIWDIEKVSDSYNIVKKSLDVESILTFTWIFPNDLYLLDKNANIFKVDTANISTSKMQLDTKVQDILNSMELKSRELHLKAHFDGMILFAPNNIFILEVKKGQINLINNIQIDQTIINIAEFTTSYKFIAWTRLGRLVTVTTTESAAELETSLTNDPWSRYNAACFVPKFPGFFVSIDKYQMIRVVDSTYKKELWKKQINIEAISMIPYPNLPAFILGTMEGRLMFFSLELPTQPVEFDEPQESVKAKINVKYVGDILIHRNPIDTMVMDSKTCLCAAASKEEGAVVVVDAKNITKVVYLDEASVEGKVIDVHISHKTLLILSTSPGCEENYGDLVTIVRVDQKKRSLTVANVLELACPCSGLLLSDNCRYFFSLLLTNKHLAKFPVTEEEQVARVAPVSSVPSGHELGLHMIQQTEWGKLALLGRDGRISLHSTDLGQRPEVFDLHHYQAGGVIDANIAANGNILCVSEDGTLVLFQVDIFLLSTLSLSTPIYLIHIDKNLFDFREKNPLNIPKKLTNTLLQQCRR